MTLETQTIARACGKTHVHNHEPEDLVGAQRRSRRHGARALAEYAIGFQDREICEGDRCNANLGDIAKTEIKYFLISFVDLFGTMRAKIVRRSAIDAVAKSGGEDSRFASGTTCRRPIPTSWPRPDSDSLFRLPGSRRWAWVAFG